MVPFRAVQCLLVIAGAVSTIHCVAMPSNTAAGLRRPNQRYHDWPPQVADSVYDSSWPGFVEKTTRWSTYAAPTFNGVFLPRSEKDLAIGVNRINPVVSWN